ncbi:hypothetical protein BH10CYA1_BH10CYA1_30640 [soil metagenome]
MQNQLQMMSELTVLVMPLLAVAISQTVKGDQAKLKSIIYGQLTASLLSLSGLSLNLLAQKTVSFSLLPGFVELRFDFLSACMLLLITSIASVIVCFSERYMLGDQTRIRFSQLLVLLASAASVLVASNSIVLSLICWHAISILLWKTISLRKEARMSAKLVLDHHLISDILFMGASALLLVALGSTDIENMDKSAARLKEQLVVSGIGLSCTWADCIGVLLVLSLSIKSALFPFHRWLTSTLDAPTPLSGLLHAGVVNVSAVIAARLFPVLAESTMALALWTLIALSSAIIGTVAMSAQFDVKRKLVYSTVGQMGFMCLQCATGCIPAAIFHLIAHGLFKCHMFLQSGSGVSEGMTKKRWGWSDNTDAQTTNSYIVITLLSVLAFAISAWILRTGAATAQSACSALIASVAMLSALSSFKRIGFLFSLLGGLTMISLFAISCTTAEHFEAVFSGLTNSRSLLLPICMLWFAFLGGFISLVRPTSLGRALYVAALNGFYVGQQLTPTLKHESKNSNQMSQLEAR